MNSQFKSSIQSNIEKMIKEKSSLDSKDYLPRNSYGAKII